MSFEMFKDFMTVNEAAAKWKVSTRYVRQLCAKGKLNAYKIGNLWLIPHDATLGGKHDN